MESWNIIIYIPAYNAEKSISELVSRINKVKPELQKRGTSLKRVIIVNDGSTDKTLELLTEFKKRSGFVEIITRQKNEGPVKTLFEGMKNALETIKENNYNPCRTLLIRMDSDLEHQPEDIERLIVPIIKGESNISVGYIPFDSRSGSALRQFNENVGLEESRKFLNVDIPQFCPGFNAIRADVSANLFTKLEEKSRIFEKVYGEQMLSVDFVILVLAKTIGEKITVIKLRSIEDGRIKKPSAKKMSYYKNSHKKTMAFLEEWCTN